MYIGCYGTHLPDFASFCPFAVCIAYRYFNTTQQVPDFIYAPEEGTVTTLNPCSKITGGITKVSQTLIEKISCHEGLPVTYNQADLTIRNRFEFNLNIFLLNKVFWIGFGETFHPVHLFHLFHTITLRGSAGRGAPYIRNSEKVSIFSCEYSFTIRTWEHQQVSISYNVSFKSLICYFEIKGAPG